MRKLALILASAALLATPAMAQPSHYGDRDGRYDRGDRGDHRDYRDDRGRRADRWDGPPPRHWNRGKTSWGRHVRACMERYRTYNPRTDTYVVRRGVTARCRL